MINADLQAACDLFAELHPEFGTPDGADGNCGYATDLFIEFLTEVLPEQAPPPTTESEVHFTTAQNHARIAAWSHLNMWDSGLPTFAYEEAPHSYYLGGLSKHPGHVVALIGATCIDWTARQFRQDAPFPLIFKVPPSP